MASILQTTSLGIVLSGNGQQIVESYSWNEVSTQIGHYFNVPSFDPPSLLHFANKRLWICPQALITMLSYHANPSYQLCNYLAKDHSNASISMEPHDFLPFQKSQSHINAVVTCSQKSYYYSIIHFRKIIIVAVNLMQRLEPLFFALCKQHHNEPTMNLDATGGKILKSHFLAVE